MDCRSDSVLYFFFFKQKTAYEMRISDWSSDVCSSDLAMTAVLEPDGMSAVRCGQVAGVQAESKTAVRPRTLALDLDGQEGRVLHIDVQLFGRRHEHMAAIRLAPPYGGKEPPHGCPSYRRSFMIPCPVGSDPHAAITARPD